VPVLKYGGLTTVPYTGSVAGVKTGGGLRILLDEMVDDPGPASSAPLPAAMAAAARAIRAQPLSATVKGIELDPPTGVDDDDFLDLLRKEKNPPKEFLKALKKLY
jgi:hypothetical protein